MEEIKSQTSLSLPELSIIIGTRAMLGAGIALLLADRINSEQRKAVGWTLFITGTLISFPIAFQIFGGQRLIAFDIRSLTPIKPAA